MARISKTDEAVLGEHGFVFEDVPEIGSSRISAWDSVWQDAAALCRRHANKSLRVRSYSNASSAYKDAKQINNGESRYVTLEEGEEAGVWTAVAGQTGNMTEDRKGNEKHEYAIWLTYNG